MMESLNRLTAGSPVRTTHPCRCVVWFGLVWFERYGYVSTERSVVCVLVGMVGGLHDLSGKL